MIFSTLYFPWLFLLALRIAEIEMHITHRRTEDFFVAGLVFKLLCNRNSQNVSVSWTRVPGQSLANISGISIKDDALWFLPADLAHSGQYSCLSRKGSETWETIFDVSVHNETCPRRNREDEVKSTEKLVCFLPHIFDLDPGAQVTWRKNCHPLVGTHSRVFPVNRSSENVGFFTCFVNFSFEGQNYTSAQTTQIYSLPLDFVVTRPEILYPKEVTRAVTLGESFELSCKALVGENDMEETDMYWMSDSLDLDYKTTTLTENERQYKLCNLFISEVTAEHLNTDLFCVVQHAAGSDSGSVRLIPASQKERHYWISLGLAALVALLAAAAFLFRVDLVLACRDVCPSAAGCSDGKSYDAYVSYLHGDQLDSSPAMTFALDFLPAVFEDLYGYKLFIGGRDELPGEAVHEVVADRMSRSRRLIIVLTSQSCVETRTDAAEKRLLSDCGVRLDEASSDRTWTAYEQRVGLYDALVKQGLKVILVQVEDGVEEALLPESLRYIRRTKGVLRWRQNGGDRANKRFWKHMRYHMPPAQRR